MSIAPHCQPKQLRPAFGVGVTGVAIAALVIFLSGCAAVEVQITKSDGTTISASGFSVLKDHGLESMSYERAHDAKAKGVLSPASESDSAAFHIGGYSSTSRIELLLKLLEAAK